MGNPFDDLENGDDGTEDSEIDVTPTDSQGRPQASSTSEEDTPTHVESTRRSDLDESELDDLSGPAFEYSEVRQKPLYARDTTWTRFETTLRTTITPQLAEEGIVDEETREIHDAVLRLANEEPERVADLVLEERRRE